MFLRHEITYEAPAGEVFEMLADRAFRQASARAQEVVSADVSITRTAEGMSVRIDQVQPTLGVPSFARKFAGETTRAIQTEEWSSSTKGTIRIETPGKPTLISGTLALTESGGVTTEVLEADAKVKVPLIGARLESVMVDLVRQGLEKEHAVGVAWLKGER